MLLDRVRSAEQAERSAGMLDLVGVEPDRRRLRDVRLSGGEQQRVAVAVALANRPAVLLADEPTGELDTASAGELFDAFRRVNRELGTTVILVTHDPLVADHVGRTIAIRDGRTSSETLRSPGEGGSDGTVTSEEFAVLDRSGRLQLPRTHVEALGLRSRVRLRSPRMTTSGSGRTPRPPIRRRGVSTVTEAPRVATAPMLEARGLVRDFPSGDGVMRVLDGIDLVVPAGSVVAVTGRSGAGKTTLLNLLGGLDRPTAGDAVVDGRALGSMSDAGRVALRREAVTYIFRAPGLVPILSAAENVEVPLRLRRTASAERDSRVATALDEVGLGTRSRHRPDELSGASSSAWPSHGRSSPGRGSCSPTSPRPSSTTTPAWRSPP